MPMINLSPKTETQRPISRRDQQENNMPTQINQIVQKYKTKKKGKANSGLKRINKNNLIRHEGTR